VRGKASSRAAGRRLGNSNKVDFGEAFGVSGGSYSKPRIAAGSSGELPTIGPRPSYDEEIRLAPYPYISRDGPGSISGDI